MSERTFREKALRLYGEAHIAAVESEYAEKYPPKVTANDVLREMGFAAGWVPESITGRLAQALADARNGERTPSPCWWAGCEQEALYCLAHADERIDPLGKLKSDADTSWMTDVADHLHNYICGLREGVADWEDDEVADIIRRHYEKRGAK